MFSLQLNVKGLKESRKLVRNFPRAMVSLDTNVRKEIAKALIDELILQTRAHKKVATGHLINDIYYRTYKNKTTVYFGKPRSAYATYVDLGSKNKKPPNPLKTRIGYSLYAWVLLRGLVARPRRRTYTGTKIQYGKPYTPSRKQLAYMIAKHLAREKTQATHITRKAYRRVQRKIDRIIREEVDRVLSIYGL